MAASLSVVGWCESAWAGDTVIAESLFREARGLMDAGKYAKARVKLTESFAQDPATGTLLALAYCQEELGQTASAWATYGEAASRSKREGNEEREQAARERRNALESQLSRLTVTVSKDAAATAGLVVRRDNVELGQAIWGSALAIDPGTYVIEASAPGRATWKTRVVVGRSADSKVVEVPALVDVTAAAGAPAAEPAALGAAPASTEPEPDRAPIEAEPAGSPLRTVGIIVGSVGVVSLGLGAFFGLRAKSLADDSDANCNANVCDQTGYDTRNDALGAGNVATVAFIAGGVLAATGVTLFIVGGSDTTDSARLEAAPALGPGTAGMMLRGAL